MSNLIIIEDSLGFHFQVVNTKLSFKKIKMFICTKRHTHIYISNNLCTYRFLFILM